MHRSRVETLFHIPKMICHGCIAALSAAVRAVDHAARVEADLAARTVRIVSSRSAPALLGTLREAGFPAEPVLQPLG
jgi:copper chaperone